MSQYCPDCGATISAGANFCSGCGRPTLRMALNGRPAEAREAVTRPRVVSVSHTPSPCPAPPAEARSTPLFQKPAPPDNTDPSCSLSLVSQGKEAVRQGLRERTIDLEEMPRGIRALAILGYVCVTALLLAVLLFELLGNRLPNMEFQSEEKILQVPSVVVAISGLALGVGWALVLTGASDCRRQVFLPVAGLFLVTVLVLSAAVPDATFGIPLLVMLVVALLVGARLLFARHLRYWRDFPVVEFFVWLAVTLILIITWFFGESSAEVASTLEASSILVLLISIVFWFLLGGLETVDVAAHASRLTILGLRRLLPGRMLRMLITLALLAQPVIMTIFVLVLALLTGSFETIGLVEAFFMSLLVLGVPVSVLLFFWMLVLVVRRRWTVRAATTLLASNLAWFVLAAGVALALGDTDFTEFALATPGLIPPAFLFAGLMAYDVLNLGVRFANTEGRLMPRSGRTLMYFGVVILMVGFALFFLNVREMSGQLDDTLQNLVSFPFLLGALFLGPAYLVWIVSKRRERLIGDDAGPPRSTIERDSEFTADI